MGQGGEGQMSPPLSFATEASLLASLLPLRPLKSSGALQPRPWKLKCLRPHTLRGWEKLVWRYVPDGEAEEKNEPKITTTNKASLLLSKQRWVVELAAKTGRGT